MKSKPHIDEQFMDVFMSDISLVMNVAKHIDQQYASAKREFIHNFVHFKHLLKHWNKKYLYLRIEHYEDGIQINLKLILKDTMENAIKAAMKMPGLRAIDGRLIPANASYHNRIERINHNKIELLFGSNVSENSLTLQRNGNEVHLIYEKKDITSEGPEFALAAYYAMKSWDSSINLQMHADYFNFDTSLEKREGSGDGYLNRVRLFDRI